MILAGAAPSAAIIGGSAAERGDYPFFVRVGKGKSFCGGSLITPTRVLSAAHCRELTGVGEKVLIGPDEIVRRVELIGTHPVAVREQRRNESDAAAPADLLLLELDSPVTGLAPVPIGTSAEGLAGPGTPATVIGFGATRLNGKGGGTFRSAAVRIQDPKTCRPEISSKLWREWSLCTRDPRLPDPDAKPPFASPCFGDSGGPLLVDPGDGPRIVGVVSFGAACGTERDPEIYANVVRAGPYLLSETPRWAPLANGATEIVGRPRVGRRVKCAVDWIVEPTEPPLYLWTIGLRGLPDEGPRLKLRPAFEGRKVSCAVIGQTAGGSASATSGPGELVRG